MRLLYHIEALLEVDAECPADIEEVFDTIRNIGAIKVKNVKGIGDNEWEEKCKAFLAEE